MKQHELPNFDQLVSKFAMQFPGLSANEHKLLFWNKEIESFKKGSLIYWEGDFAKGSYFIYSGILKIFKTGTEGKEQIVHFAKGGELTGFRSSICNEAFCTSAKAIEHVFACFVPIDLLKKLLCENAEFSIQFIKHICTELGEANNYIANIAQKTVRERLSGILLQLEAHFGVNEEGNLKISLSREELANIVGTSTESVIRLLSEFKSDHFIQLNGRKIRILNHKQLRKTGRLL